MLSWYGVQFYGIRTPARVLVSGSSRTGKTTTILKLLNSELISKFSYIYLISPGFDSNIDDFDQLYTCEYEIINHIPDMDFLTT